MVSSLENKQTSALAANLQVTSQKTVLYSVFGWTSNATPQWLQIHDLSDAPSANAVPIISIPISSAIPFSIDLTARGHRFANGVYICNSTTGPTFTAGSADCWINTQFERVST